jgi:phosphatidyl-myo-inositol dimannoside synthase
VKTLFLTLRTFSATGGIEKVCKILGKALYEESIENESLLQVCSMYDRQLDAFNNRYFPTENFRGYGINKFKFISEMILAGLKFDRVILSHINLLPVGWLIKKLSPRTKLFLLAHGIEIWYPVGPSKKKMLNNCDKIIAVSNYTANKIREVHGLPSERVLVLNNCLDPFLPLPSIHKKDQALLHKYGFEETDTILMTLTRLSSTERYKGYDKVFEAIASIRLQYPGIRYLIAGKYDSREKAFIDSLLKKLNIQNVVVMTGFITEESLEAHYAMSDIYVMPSRKEGFGIVFIEAMYYGLPVIAGNADGSVDAVLNGELGQLVNPDNVKEIEAAIVNIIKRKKAFIPSGKLLSAHFSYDVYKEKLKAAIN